MQSVRILPAYNKGKDMYELVIRRHDLGGTDYEHICYITEQKAISINNANRDIGFVYGHPYEKGKIT